MTNQRRFSFSARTTALTKTTQNRYLFATTVLFAIVGFSLLLVPSTTNAAKAKSAAKLRYNSDVRPILAENCFPCHGPDSASRKAGLRLDKFADATRARDDGGNPAIVAGDPIASRAIRRILGHDGPLMPPMESHKQLSEAQKAILTRWVEQGAQYEPHWSYLAPKKPKLPVVKNAAWPKNGIDYFVLARLEREGLKPAPEADRRTLARRVALDLTGLPPAPADVEAFVRDMSPDAYEKLVDKYLQSEQWGEHRARYWLDAARYADTHGIHFDNFREMWSYRDWVIDAYNRNLPYDRFAIEQLAGDLLPKPTTQQRIASGFNRCNITTNEGGAIEEEYNVLYARDRTETFGQVFLGATAGCAVCHDHKFDPLSQKEFYSLSAYFNNFTQRAMDGNVRNTPPVIPLPAPADAARFAALEPEFVATTKRLDERGKSARPEFDKYVAATTPAMEASRVPAGDSLHLLLPMNEKTGQTFAALVDNKAQSVATVGAPAWTAGGATADSAPFRREKSEIVLADVGDFEGDTPFSCAVWVKARPNSNGAVLARMDEGNGHRGWDFWIQENRVGPHLIHKWEGDALKVVTREPIASGKWQHICFTYDGSRSANGIKVYVNGAAQSTNIDANTLKGTIRTPVPFKVGQRNKAEGVDGLGVQDVRVYRRVLTDVEVRNVAFGTRASYLLARAAKRTKDESEELFSSWLGGGDTTYRAIKTELDRLNSERTGIVARGTIAHVSQEKDQPAMAHVLFRGDYDKRREQVGPATPAILPKMPAQFPKNRLGLARWLFVPNHPLTARVAANRMWQELFGQGLVRTSGDFGISGELPSHPELLDYLAVRFRETRWDTKQFYKTLVMSATYRQAAITTPMKRRLDNDNRLLSRGPRFRMDAEMVRDYALASSGILVRKVGGPSVRTYQPDGVWEAVTMPGSDTRNYSRDRGASLYRRSLYTFWKRSAPPASLEIFNGPSRETCTVRRERTNTPLQTLVTLNDIQYVEAARRLAERALYSGGTTDRERMNWVARRILARPLRQPETIVVETTLADLEAHYAKNPKQADELTNFGESKTETDLRLPAPKVAAWTVLVNQLMNLDEALNK